MSASAWRDANLLWGTSHSWSRVWNDLWQPELAVEWSMRYLYFFNFPESSCPFLCKALLTIGVTPCISPCNESSLGKGPAFCAGIVFLISFANCRILSRIQPFIWNNIHYLAIACIAKLLFSGISWLPLSSVFTIHWFSLFPLIFDWSVVCFDSYCSQVLIVQSKWLPLQWSCQYSYGPVQVSFGLCCHYFFILGCGSSLFIDFLICFSGN